MLPVFINRCGAGRHVELIPSGYINYAHVDSYETSFGLSQMPVVNIRIKRALSITSLARMLPSNDHKKKSSTDTHFPMTTRLVAEAFKNLLDT
jgi:hypothetical protein